MGSVAISLAGVSDQVYHPSYTSTMLGGAVNRAANSSSTESTFRSSPSRSTSQQREPPPGSTNSSRPTSTANNNTPTSSTVASTNPPPYPSSQDGPAYIRPQPQQQHPGRNPSPRGSIAAATMTASHQGPPLDPPLPRETSDYLTAAHPTDPRHPPFPPDASQGSAHAGAPLGYSGQSRLPVPQTATDEPSSPRLQPTHPSSRSLGGSEATSPSRIKVRDLSHIQSFASEEFLEQSQRARRPGRGPQEVGRQYEISSMPVTDIIEMVAGLLTKITSTNDMQHEHIHRYIPPPDGAASLSPQASSVLAFHGKNVPSITILSYLTRIHKYCPTTYEVFLSLLVYFDRMTEKVNSRPIQRKRHLMDSVSASARSYEVRSRSTSTAAPISPPPTSYPSIVTPPSSSGMTAQDPKSPESSVPSSLQLDEEDDDSLTNFFVVDSFNIHRLVIAGVTCASKFFSDVFYTNSRYAKVGGLPLVELNHLELQFLLLNEFRLSVPVEELEAYGTMLVEFYAREVVTQQQQASFAAIPPVALGNPSGGSSRRGGSEFRQTSTPPQS